MQAFTRLDGRAVPLSLANIDTDQIIPKQFLKTVEREGLAKGLFYDFRFDGEGSYTGTTVIDSGTSGPAIARARGTRPLGTGPVLIGESGTATTARHFAGSFLRAVISKVVGAHFVTRHH